LIEGQSLADETGADGAKDISDQEEPLEVRVGALRETERCFRNLLLVTTP